MQHLIDLDTEYDMQEKEENEALDKENELILDIHRSEVSEGIVVTDHMTTIQLKVSPFDESVAPVPSMILFDSLDAHFHDKEFEEKKGNVVTVTTENQGIAIKSVTTILAETGDIYAALTGDQCAITNIRIHS